MKILVADDDALIRRLLHSLLTKLGHEVVAAEDGNAALKAFEGQSPPPLAIIDWVMPGLNGVEVCKKIRTMGLKPRPYVLLLSAKSDKQEIITGLDAGADDYLVKPFDPMALMARLRVAQRIIDYEQELHQSIGAMEALLQRHNLLGEIFGKQSRAAEPPAAAKIKAAPEPPARSKETSANDGLPILAPDTFGELVTRSIAEVGLGQARATVMAEAASYESDSFTAWTPLVLVKEGLWLDLLMEVDDVSGVAMFESLLGRIPVSERELLDFLAETFNLISTSIKASLSDRGFLALAPVISRSIRTSALTIRPSQQAVISHHQFTLPEIVANMTVVRQVAPSVSKSLGQLHELDMLAENLPSPSTSDVFLLNQGVMFNERYIEKLSSLAKSENTDLRVSVIKPSRFAEFFCLGRISTG